MAKKPVSDQMELFENGGFKDQGNTKDPVSNNPVPVGSTKKEVRDDIPANLSEGEFVLPADVVRYHGLEKIMGFRDQAKQGLEKMENMGQMGNSDQATIPDGVPFQQMAEGGAVPVPTIQQPEVVAQNKIPGVQYVAPTTQAVRPSIYSFNQQMPQVTVPTQPSVTVPTQPNYQTPAYRQSTSTAETPKFSNLLGTQFGQLQESVTKRYVNDAGEEMYIPFVNGEPIYPIPNGFREEAEDAIKKEDEDVNKAVQSTSVRQQQSDDGDSGGFDASSTQDYKVAMQLARGKEDALIAQGKGSLIGKVGRFLETGAKAITGFSLPGMIVESKKDTTGSTIDPLSGLYDEELDQVGANVKEAYALQSGYSSLADMTKQYGVQPTFKFGTEPGDVSLVTGKPYNFAGQSKTRDGTIAFTGWDAWTDNLSDSNDTGWSGGFTTEQEIKDAIKAHDDRVKSGVQGYSGKWDRQYVDAYNAKIAEKNGGYIDNKGNFVKGSKDDDDSKTKKTPSVIGSGKTDITSKVKDVKPDADFYSPSDVGTGNIKTYDPVLTSAREAQIFGRAGERKSNVLPSKGSIRDDASRVGTTFTSPSGIDNSIYQTNDNDSGNSDGGGSQPDSSSSSDMGFSTASGGFIQKKNLPKANKKKRGGLASRR